MATILRHCLLLAICAGTAPLLHADADAGKALYGTCVACHGDQAQGNQAMNAPALAHLDAAYIAAQLDKFKSGQRGGAGDTPYAAQMAGMANVLADQNAMNDVALYIASLAPSSSPATIEGDAAMGGDYYNQFCGACHGPAADGNPALNSPRLAGADDWYLYRQIMAFRDGQRGANPDDRTGKQMRAMAAVLPSEQAVKDVVAFIKAKQ